MMLMPRRKELNLWEDMFKDPFFSNDHFDHFDRIDRLMKTDIKEKNDKYLIDVDLPGYEKENIKIAIENGYLNINATTNSKNDDEDGEFVRRERYFGECSRSFYVGDDITEEDIKASFKNGTLRLEVPKKEPKKGIPEKKYIQIED